MIARSPEPRPSEPLVEYLTTVKVSLRVSSYVHEDDVDEARAELEAFADAWSRRWFSHPLSPDHKGAR